MKLKMSKRFMALLLSAVMLFDSGGVAFAAEVSGLSRDFKEETEFESAVMTDAAETKDEEISEDEVKEAPEEDKEAWEEIEEFREEDKAYEAEDESEESIEEQVTAPDSDAVKEGKVPEEDETAELESPSEEKEAKSDNSVEDNKAEEKDIKDDYPAQHFEKKSGKVRIRIDAPEGAFPKGTKLKIKKVRSGSVVKELRETTGNRKLKKNSVIAYDFNFYTKDEENIEPLREISVKFENLDKKKDISVFHMEDKDSSPEEIETEEKDTETGLVSIKTDRFSIYALVMDPEDEDKATDSDASYEDEFDITTNFDSSISLADGDNRFYGGELIYLYNDLAISGNAAKVREGSYTLIYLAKDKFTAPKATDISDSFDKIERVELYEDDDNYIIKTVYKELYGGFNGATPIKVSLLARETENLSDAVIRQEYRSPSGKKLSESEVEVHGKAAIESPQSIYYGTTKLDEKLVDENFKLKEGTYIAFPPNYVSYPNSNVNDPRDRRVYANIPKGARLKPDSPWTYEAKSGKYYRDLKREEVTSGNLTLYLDLSGEDFNEFDDPNKTKTYTVSYSIQPLKDGVVQTDLGPNTWYSTKHYYILKPGTPPPDAYVSSANPNRNYLFIGKDYKALKGRRWSDYNSINIPYDKSQVSEIRIAFNYTPIYSFSIANSKGDEEAWKLKIKSAKTEVPGYSYPSELRLFVRGLTDEDSEYLKELLKGTKAYGIKYDGSRELITENIPVVTGINLSTDLGSDGWHSFEGSEYKAVDFVFPGEEGIVLTGKEEIQKFYAALNTVIIADIRESVNDDLKALMDANKTPSISGFSSNAKGYSVYDDKSYTTAEAVFKKKDTDEAQSVTPLNLSRDTDTHYKLQYETITANNYIGITNGSSFYVHDTITTRLSYTHSRYGNFADATQPENLIIYYLVPDGLEPIEDSNMFASMEVIKDYLPGKNLIAAKPKSIKIPGIVEGENSIQKGVANYYELSFKVTDRVDIGKYHIEAAVVIDNNKIDVKNNRQYGILMSHTTSGNWSNITTDARNRSEDEKSYTSLNYAPFSVYPPKVLVSTKSVKLASEPDSLYASSVGDRAHIGDSIDYRWRLQNNSTQDIRSLIVLDILPFKGDKAIVENEAGDYPGRGSAFSTPLIGVEPQDKFDIYYSTDAVKESTSQNADASWVTEPEDMSKVTMIKAVLKQGSSIKVGEKYDIITHNLIENNSSIKDGEKAYNSYAVSLNGGSVFIENLKTEVQATYPKRDVVVEKTDEDDSSVKLEGVSFDLYMEDEKEPVKTELKTDRNGHLTIQDLLVGKRYFLKETGTVEGYELPREAVSFTVSEGEEPQPLTVVNRKERTEVAVKKAWKGKKAEKVNIDLMAAGELKASAELNEANNWQYSFKDLRKRDPKTGEEISYTVEESGVDSEGRIKLQDSWYKSYVEGDAESGFTVVNEQLPDMIPLTPSYTKLRVHKEWSGIEAKDAPEVKVYLTKNGQKTERYIKLNNDNNWSGVFDRLAVTDDIRSGKSNIYGVVENGENNGRVRLGEKRYSVSYSSGNITNTLLPGKSGRGGGGGGGGGSTGRNSYPDPKPAPPDDTPTVETETPGDIPPAPWYKLPVMGDTQFGPGFVNERKDEISLEEGSQQRPVIDQLKGLYEQNTDLSGWITVPGTGFGYPVMMSSEFPYFYQHHTFLKNKDEVGIPFIGPYSNADSMNVLIHGHNMKDVSQFGYIWNYQYKEFRDKNPVIDFKTLYDADGAYEVMAVFFAPEYPENAQNVFWWYRYIGNMDKAQFDYFVSNAKSASLYDTGVSAEFGDKLITLETCASTTDSTRLVVIAVKKNK